MVETTASGLLFSYFFLITMAADAITAVEDAVQTTAYGSSAFFSYVEAAVTAAMPEVLVAVVAVAAIADVVAVAANSGCPQQ